MQAKEGVIDLLNRILTVDLTAVNQYFLHAKMCEHWGYSNSRRSLNPSIHRDIPFGFS